MDEHMDLIIRFLQSVRKLRTFGLYIYLRPQWYAVRRYLHDIKPNSAHHLELIRSYILLEDYSLGFGLHFA